MVMYKFLFSLVLHLVFVVFITLPTRLPPIERDSRKKYNIQGNIWTLLGKNCEVEKMIRFLKETEINEK